MKAAVTEGKGDVRIVDIAMPEPGPYQCLCRVLACATCSGTDLAIMSARLPWPEQYPAVLGHESVGEIIKVGDRVRYLREGGRCLRPTAVYPGGRTGPYHSIWGGFAEYGLVTDTRALLEDDPGVEPGYAQFQMPLPDDCGLSPAEALMLITLKETAGFVFDMKIGLNDPVVIFGAGTVAMSMCLFARLAGAFPLIVVARRDEPLDYMRRFGAGRTVNNTREDVTAAVREMTGGRGASFVIETTGDKGVMASAFELLSENGRVAPYAVYKDGRGENIDESRLLEAKTGEVATHDHLLALVKMNFFDLNHFYSHVMPFSAVADGFALLKRREAFKVVFEPVS